MANRERRSKPRKLEPVEEDETSYNWWQLGMYLVGAVAVIVLMIIVSQFLSNGNAPSWLWLALVGTVILGALLWLGGFMANRRTA